MESSLKQRLIGAAVLVALAVIFLPMLLDSPPPEAGTAAVTLDIPAPPGRDFETRELPLTPPPSTPAGSPTAPAATAPDAVATVDADVLGREDALAGAEPADVEPDAAAPAADSTAAAAAQDAIAAPADPAAAPPIAPPAPVREGRFVVNLGSFSNQGNADRLRQALEGAGLPVLAEPIDIDGKPATRLRAGPFANRSDAEAARMTAQRTQPGLAASVVTSDAAIAAPAPAAARGGFAVQVGAFRDADEAEALRARLRTGGLAAFVDPVQTDAGRMHRVRIGPENDRSRAEALQRSVRERFQLDGLVVTHP